MILATAAASMLVFMAALWLCGIVRTGAEALSTAREAVAVLADEAIGEAAREEHIQRAALRLLGATFSILGRTLVAALASAVPIVLADWAGLASTADLIGFLARWDVILAATILMSAGYLVWVKVWRFR